MREQQSQTETRTKVEACHRRSVRSASANRRSVSTRRSAWFQALRLVASPCSWERCATLTTEPALSRSITPNIPSAVDVLTKCAEETADQHDVLAIAVEHRVGHLEVGDIAVIVAVGAVHRGEALAACAHLINTLKAEVPIWKEQHFASGDSEWVGLPGEDDATRLSPSTSSGRRLEPATSSTSSGAVRVGRDPSDLDCTRLRASVHLLSRAARRRSRTLR